MQIVQVNAVSKGFGPLTVLHEVTLSIREGDRLGLVGPNGVGKSTLLRLLAGETPPDSGQIVFPRAIDVAYLPQEARFRPGQSIDSLIREAQGRVAEGGAPEAEQALWREG